MASRCAGVARVKVSLPYQISPVAGAFSPIKCRKSVLLPQPLPPMMMNTSPRRTVNVRSRISTKLPYAMVRSRTVMWAFGSVGGPCSLTAAL